MTNIHSNETAQPAVAPDCNSFTGLFRRDSVWIGGMARWLLFNLLFAFARDVREPDDVK